MEYSKIFKIYLNYNLIICSDIDIDAIIDPLSLHSLSYFSFISNKELLVLSALFLSVYESQYEVTNNNNILYCNIDSTASNQETITIKNVSPSKEEILNVEDIAIYIINKMLKEYPDNIKERYNLTNEEDIIDILDNIGKKIGAIRNKETDYDKVYITVLRDLRDGRLGKVTFDTYLPNSKN